MPNYIPIDRWGKDHWTTLAYLETCCVDRRGSLDPIRMRCDPVIHPQFAHAGTQVCISMTRLDSGVAVNHDDWSCIEDMEAEGLVVQVGTGTTPVYRLTDRG